MAERQSIADLVLAVEKDRDTLASLNDLLAARLAELEDREAAATDRDAIRRAYRRGYCTGYHAGRRRAVQVTNPERAARGWMRDVLTVPQSKATAPWERDGGDTHRKRGSE